MKVYLGPFVKWVGPYQLAEKILFWKDKYHPDFETAEKHNEQIHALGEWLSGTNEKPSLLLRLCEWIHSKQKRKVDIYIDNYDVWSADHTLALIIVPVLKKLRDQKHGCPHVDDKDVPVELRRGAAPALTEEQLNTGHTDELWEARWNWVIDEMIWAFEQHANPEWDEQYYSGESDWVLKPVEGTEFKKLDHGPNHTFKVDNKGMQKHRARMNNGRRLFAKYYESLWD